MSGFGSDSNQTYGNDSASVTDVINNGTGTEGALIVGLTAVEIKVGASKLADRKTVSLFNNSNSTIYWGWSSLVTIATGTPIFKNQFATWEAGQNQAIHVIAATAGNNTRVTEA
jgi:hypothetical protein